MNGKACLLALLSLSASVGQAQSCPPPQRPPTGPAWFDFQVEVAAKFTGDSAKLPYPDARLHRRRPFPDDFLLVQFVVDTAGRAEPQTLKLLVTPAGASADSIRAAVARWEFTPATVQQCRVPQLMQTALRWK